MALIECRHLTKTYRRGTTNITPLDALDLDIDRPTSGTLRIDGEDIATYSRKRLANWRSEYIGYIFQLYNLVPVLTAYENVELPLLLHKMSRKERHEKVETALNLVGIADRYDHYPRQLSGGQEQRVAIARAIVADPKIIVADEPTGDLDADSAAEIMKLLQQINRELNRTLIMVTHDIQTTDYAEKTLHLEKGKLLESREEAVQENGEKERSHA
jgi:putative ABC transport system ATP-binding protein